MSAQPDVVVQASSAPAAFQFPGGVTMLDCDTQTLVWSSPPSGGLRGLATDVWVRGLWASSRPTRAAQITDGGSVAAPAVSGHWVVFVDFKQVEDNPQPVAWSLRAVNIATHQAMTLASADTRPGITEAPEPSVSGSLVAWDQVLPDGSKALLTVDLSNGHRARVSLPAGSYPLESRIDGSRIVFLDVSSDPHRATEHWLGYGGTATVVDLRSGQVTRLDTDPDARGLRASGGIATWTRYGPDPRHQGGLLTQIVASPEDGRPQYVVAAVGEVNRMSGNRLAYFDVTANVLAVSQLPTGPRLVVSLGQEVGPDFAICGRTFYFTSMPSETSVPLHEVDAP